MRALAFLLLLVFPVGHALSQGFISGAIIDEAAMPLLGANVRIFDAVNAEILTTTTTDRLGNFLSGQLPAGRYKIRIDLVEFSGTECRRAYREFLGNEIPDSGGKVVHADVIDTAKDFAVVDGSTTQLTGDVAQARCPIPMECVPTRPSLDGVLIDKETLGLINGVLIRAKDPINAMPKVPDLVSGEIGDGVFSWRLPLGCPVGDAKVRFFDPMGRYSPEYYLDKDDNFALGDVVSLDEGANLNKVFLSRVSPSQQLANLANQVSSMPITDQVKNSLTHLLGQAKTLLEDANPNNDKSACGLLNAFINRLDGLVASRQITSDMRAVLTSGAQDIQKQLNCKN